MKTLIPAPISKISHKFRWLSLTHAFIFISVVFLIFLLIKCVIYIDASGDTWMYQLPFAARLWGIVPESYYLFEGETQRETTFIGYPLLANFLQGFFWKFFGVLHPQGANLLSFFALIGFIIFLQNYFKIPFYYSAISLLAVPLIHIATTACYVDLFGNIGVAITILMTYLLYTKDNFLSWRNVIIFTIGGAIAGNTKFLLTVPVAIVLAFVLGKIITSYWLKIKEHKKPIQFSKIGLLLRTTVMVSCVMFFTEIKNLILYGNPLYPLKVQIGNIVLNHAVNFTSATYVSENLRAMFPLHRWIHSLLEIGAFDSRRPLKWTIAMDFVPLDSDSYGVGGYFAIYVVFNVLLLLYLGLQKNRDSRTALGLFIIMSLVTAFMPLSHQLRFYMYWMMVVISLNLYLLIQLSGNLRFSWIKAKYFTLLATVILFNFATATHWDYTYPEAYSLQKLMNNVDYSIVEKIQDGEDVCLVGFTPFTFLYNAKFHPPKQYSVLAEFKISPEHTAKFCGDRTIIENPKLL